MSFSTQRSDEMKCESCNEREATIHISKGNGFEKTEKFLCEQCANASFENDFSYPDDSFNIQKLLKSLSEHPSLQQTKRRPKQCATCGSTINTIVQMGKFGWSRLLYHLRQSGSRHHQPGAGPPVGACREGACEGACPTEDEEAARTAEG